MEMYTHILISFVFLQLTQQQKDILEASCYTDPRSQYCLHDWIHPEEIDDSDFEASTLHAFKYVTVNTERYQILLTQRLVFKLLQLTSRHGSKYIGTYT